MATEWYCKISDQQFGPLSSKQLKALAMQGRLRADHLVRNGADGPWRPAARVKGLFGSSAAAPPPPIPINHPSEPSEIVIEADRPTARLTGRGGSRPPGSRAKQRQNLQLIVWLLAVLAALSATALLLAMFHGGDSTSRGKTRKVLAAKGRVDRQDEEEQLEQWDPDAPRTPRARRFKPAAAPRRAKPSATGAEVNVTIASAEICSPRLVLGENRFARPKRKYLRLVIRLENISNTKRLDYKSWTLGRAGVSLNDDIQNSYKLKTFHVGRIDGQLRTESIHPNKAIEDVLIFEKPVEKAELLRLRLPAAAFGGQGVRELRIPVSEIATQPDRPDSSP